MSSGTVPPLEGGFHIPWSEVDPTLQHGGIAGQLAEGFVAAKLGDNTASKNMDARTVFAVVRDFTASVSMHPEANIEGPPQRGIVEDVLRGLNWVLERLWDRTRSSADVFFTWTHATPPSESFRLRPVRFPLRNEFAHTAIETLLGSMIEIAEMNANAHHTGFDPSSTARMLGPFLVLKANLMRDFFDKEIGGQITAQELATLFAATSPPPGPTIVPPGQEAPTPTSAAVAVEQQGADVVQWFPTPEDWAVFGRKRDALYKAERIFQPEAAFGTTEDVSPPMAATPPSGGSSALTDGG